MSSGTTLSDVVLRDITQGFKITDDVILLILKMVREQTGVDFVEPAVLAAAKEFPNAAIVPDFSGVSRSMMIVHLGERERTMATGSSVPMKAAW